MKKIIAVLCFIHWPVFGLLADTFNLYTPWYLSENHIELDILKEIMQLVISCYGLSVLFPMANSYIYMIILVFFTCYEYGVTVLGKEHYLTKLSVDRNTDAVLIKNESALGRQLNQLNLKSFHNHGDIFLTTTTIYSYNHVISARIQVHYGGIEVTVDRLSGTVQDIFPIYDFTYE